MRIMFDLDGCYYNFGDSVKRYLEQTNRGHIWKSGPTPQPFWNFFEDWGWDIKDFVKLCNEGADAGVIFTGPMRDGGKEAWDRIEATGNQIIIATDRSFGTTPEVSEKNTLEWLEEHELWYDELWFTNVKPDCEPDVAVDDKAENFYALLEAGVDAYLIDRPWNQEVDAGHRRLPDVLAFAEIVENLTSMV